MQDFKDNVSRLAIGLLELNPELSSQHGEKVLDKIGETLKSFKLKVICGEQVMGSMALQAALLTVINSGKRCFKGGVTVVLESDVKPLIKWPGDLSLIQIVKELGATVISEDDSIGYTVDIVLGHDSKANSWRVLCNAWTGGVVPPGSIAPSLNGSQDFPLGGILGGAMAVGLSFLKVAGFDPSIGSEPTGISLWRPDLNWISAEAQGPSPKEFPSKLWFLGLGHLGQAYAWCLGMLPFEKPNELLVKLQDDDKAVTGNIDSGLLTENRVVGIYKTRIVSDWLEKRGISTRIVERKYDDHYSKQETDPGILLAGLDKVLVRTKIKTSEFLLVLDAGLGVGLNFDLIRLNMFPNIGRTPAELWGTNTEAEGNSTPAFNEYSKKILGCGVSLGVASAFVGCVSGCIIIAELLRSYSGGIKLSHFYLTLREASCLDVGVLGEYKTETFVGKVNLK
jgi:hypothetical protein